MTIVRIAHVEPRPGRLPDGGFQTRGVLVVLADEAGRRAVPIWLREPAGGDLAHLLPGPQGRSRRAALPRNSPPGCCARPARA